MNILKNQRIEAEILGYNSRGQGVARIGGRAVFVEGGARGDRARLHIVKVTSSAVYAKIEALLCRSPRRMEPQCPAFGRCGGCAYAHLQYEEEFNAKIQQIVDALTRLGGCASLPEIEEVPAKELAGYRNKALFPVANGPDRPVWGFYRPRSHHVVPLTACLIQDPRANAAANAVVGWMHTNGISAYDQALHSGLVRHIFARTGTRGCLLGVVANGGPQQARSLVSSLRAACPDAEGILWIDNREPGNVVLQGSIATLWGRPYIEETLCGLTFRIGALSFFQINRIQAEALYGLAMDFAGTGETAVDLYCGTGTIALCLARRFSNVWGIETVSQAIHDAQINAAHNGLPAQFIRADAAEGLAALLQRGVDPAAIVVDPPRKGLSPTLADALKTSRRVVYLSCNPATLARDIKLLRQNGFSLSRLAAVDMFPRTAHIECAALLQRTTGNTP